MGVHVVTDENDFNAKLADAGGKSVFVDFGAEWCGPCKRIAPAFVDLSEEFKDCVFLTVDIDQVPKLEERFVIRGIPSFMVFKNKNKVAELVGGDKEKLRSFVVEHK